MKYFMIKFYINFGVLMLVATASFAQQDTTLVYASRGYMKDPVRSKWNHVVEQKGAAWLVSFYNNKKLREQITYADQDLHVRNGRYAQYYEKGDIAYDGNFEKGYKVGEWRFYYTNKQLAEKLNYTWGKLNGEYLSFWENGNVKSRGRYVMDKKTGLFRTYHLNEKIAAEEIYNEEGKLVNSSYFDEEGKASDRKPINMN